MQLFKDYGWLWILVVIVLFTGLVFPELMDFDAAEYAGISMHMFNSNDWGTILNRNYSTGQTYDYLDKPHVLYWSSFPGFSLFGITHYGYRLGSVLMSLAAAWATFKTGKLLYGEKAGKMAGLFFITAQTILLANHDVRTDTLLTAFTILAIYHLVSFIQKNHWKHIVFAGAFLAAGVGTKGLIAVLVSGSAAGSYLLFQRDGIKKLLTWKWLLLPVSFFISLSPVLYFYYQQFDLHPEKLVNGSTGMSGVKFILWTQSFERFAGGRSLVDNPEFSFFFHTFLWVFLPWSLVAYTGVTARLFEAFRTRGNALFNREQLTFLGVWIMFLFMSLSSFKLPHYLNILIPLFSIFSAAYLCELFDTGKHKLLRTFAKVQTGIIIILCLLGLVIFGWAFPLDSILVILSFVLLVSFSIYWYRTHKKNSLDKVWIPSAIAILLVNFLLNTHFYPKINQYQGGSTMAKYIKARNYPIDQLYVYHNVYRSFDFYLGEWRPMLTDIQISEKLKEGKNLYFFTNEEGMNKLSATFKFSVEHKTPDYHITAISAKFLNPSKRKETYNHIYLLKITP